MDHFEKFRYIGAAIGDCAGIKGCEEAPDAILKRFPYLAPCWDQTIEAIAQANKVAMLEDFSLRLAKATKKVVEQNKKFITFGGDHSCAIGTWSGVAAHHDRFGLIWIDAHMDAHTFKTSPSGNLHGMPIACLLGEGDPALTSILSEKVKVQPELLSLIGIRSFEPGEAQLLEDKNVAVHFSKDVQKFGLLKLLEQHIADFQAQNIPFGISLDLDGLDPSHIDALGTPEKDGLDLEPILHVFENMNLDNFIGLEITEYNPSLDNDQQSGLGVIERIIDSITCRFKTA